MRFGKSAEKILAKPLRQRLLEGLKELGLLDTDITDADSQRDGKGTKSIAELSDEEYERLKELLEETLRQA
ncbi:hypothetical protein [Pyrodictium abyssi]|uniref:Uncharacterized protein n=1 Tax=Pyrodictium abyssi TaxID=54256 RepID=A0ABN6ZRI0_9CREN|nr:hypothetical protein PABY_24530 [Pyrodictium abyssi]